MTKFYASTGAKRECLPEYGEKMENADLTSKTEFGITDVKCE